jgi:hypothetical protein
LQSRNQFVGHPCRQAYQAPDRHDEDCRRKDEPVVFRHGEKYRAKLHHPEVRNPPLDLKGDRGIPVFRSGSAAVHLIDRYFSRQRNRLGGDCVLRAGI